MGVVIDEVEASVAGESQMPATADEEESQTSGPELERKVQQLMHCQKQREKRLQAD